MRAGILTADRAPFLVGTGAVLVLAACFPLAQRADDSLDRARPMYADLRAMEWLQFQHVSTHGEAVPVEVSDGQTVEVGDAASTASGGVTVTVRAPDPRSYCVRAENEHGDVSRWHCLDEDDPPVDPDPADPTLG